MIQFNVPNHEADFNAWQIECRNRDHAGIRRKCLEQGLIATFQMRGECPLVRFECRESGYYEGCSSVQHAMAWLAGFSGGKMSKWRRVCNQIIEGGPA